MNYVWISLIIAAATAVGTFAAPGPDCSPAAMQDLPPRMRNMCAALYQFSSALQAYMDDQTNYQPVLRDGSQLYETGAKRQDVDHVFMRFGRRR